MVVHNEASKPIQENLYAGEVGGICWQIPDMADAFYSELASSESRLIL